MLPVSNFDNRGELDGISIVVNPKKSAGVTNDGETHVVDYYYDAIKLRRADGKPLADIVHSIKQEVVISNQEKRKNAIANLLTNGKLVWKHADDVSAASDVKQGLYSSQGNMSDPTTEGTDAPQTNVLSASKGKGNSSSAQEQTEKVAKDQTPNANSTQAALSVAE